jgi:hypothetical protein
MRNNTEVSARTEAYLFAGLAVLMGIHLCVRAALVPITYEEATRFFSMVAPAGMPTDHFLSVLWAKFCLAVFGPSLLLQRVISVAAFGLFARYAFLLGGLVRHKLVRWCVWLALLIMPFAVELFALAGGQALAIAFLLMGLWHLAQIPAAVGSRDVRLAAFVFAGLAFSNTAMWPAWGIGVLAAIAVVWRSGGGSKWQHLGLLLLVAVLPAVLLFLASASGAATAEVSAREILSKCLQLVFGSNAYWLVWTLVLAVVCMLVIGLGRWSSGALPAQRTALLSTVALLVFWPSVYILLFDPRDLLHDILPWLPLFLLAFAIALDEAVRHAAHRRWLALLLLLPVGHMLQGIHVSTTRSSGDAAIPLRLAEAVHRIQAESDHGLVIGGGARQAPSWNFGRLFDEQPLSTLQTHPITFEDADLLLLPKEQAEGVSATFRTLEEGPSGLMLLARTFPFTTRALLDTTISRELTNAEYQDLPVPDLATLVGQAITVELTVMLFANKIPGNGPFLVMEVNGPEGGSGYYAARPVDLLRGRRGRPIRITHALPLVPANAQRVAIYIWNPTQVPLAIGNAHLRILQRNDPEQATE